MSQVGVLFQEFLHLERRVLDHSRHLTDLVCDQDEVVVQKCYGLHQLLMNILLFAALPGHALSKVLHLLNLLLILGGSLLEGGDECFEVLTGHVGVVVVSALDH